MLGALSHRPKRALLAKGVEDLLSKNVILRKSM
jgi:hypothetical protein